MKERSVICIRGDRRKRSEGRRAQSLDWPFTGIFYRAGGKDLPMNVLTGTPIASWVYRRAGRRPPAAAQRPKVCKGGEGESANPRKVDI